MSAALLLTAIPGLAQQFKPVPRAYTRKLEDGVCVACPCGRRPILARGELQACEAARCWLPGVRSACERVFIATNRSVLCFRPSAA